ncbi:MAG: fimbrillin family protein, partial [Bacteroides sp.]
PMKLVLNVLVNGETAARTYSVDVPVPDGELKSGNSYRFSAVIGTSSVSFSDVNIMSWTDVDETGNPLYPKLQ